MKLYVQNRRRQSPAVKQSLSSTWIQPCLKPFMFWLTGYLSQHIFFLKHKPVQLGIHSLLLKKQYSDNTVQNPITKHQNFPNPFLLFQFPCNHESLIQNSYSFRIPSSAIVCKSNLSGSQSEKGSVYMEEMHYFKMKRGSRFSPWSFLCNCDHLFLLSPTHFPLALEVTQYSNSLWKK